MPENMRRTVAATVAVDGRTLEIRCVPYGVTARVQDPGGPVYEEEFAPGAFRRNVRAPHRVGLNVEHEHSVMSLIGHGRTLEERGDGLYGHFPVVSGPVGDHALALVGDGVLGDVSIEFFPLGPGRRGDRGQVIRTACHLDHVSLCRVGTGAYPGAEVLAVRHHPAAGRLVVRDGALDARLGALGVAPRR